jgi:hypothetical protein
MSEDKKFQTEGKIADTDAENPELEEEFEVSEDELEDAAGGRRIRGEVQRPGRPGKPGDPGGLRGGRRG